jgi:DNA-binding NarL/FixJ family response regulator
VRELASALECVAGVLWLPEGDVLVAHVTWCSDDETSDLASLVRQVRLPRGVGLAGRVWEEREPLMVPNLEDDPRFSGEAVASQSGAVALPASSEEEVLAVLELYLCDAVIGNERDRLRSSLADISHALGRFLAHRRGELKPSPLTPRELEVLQLAAQGRNVREIAERLVVSPATVRRHLEHIYEKYGVSDRAAAVAQGLRDGLIK